MLFQRLTNFQSNCDSIQQDSSQKTFEKGGNSLRTNWIDVVFYFYNSVQIIKRLIFLVEARHFDKVEQSQEIVGVKGLSRCQQRWRRHVSPQRELEIQTSTENTAPDIQMCPCLLTDGTKQDPEDRETRQKTEGEKKEIRETGEEFVTTQSLFATSKLLMP